ncbi:hypothetical protein [Piscibacillus salipiscarius]|uniref:hypothetical protein n=1 Tax=Piscibacillus salipiscarius TaxID=299480 RepID=UPI0006CF4F69|nr:hypothetical protein [Piscibacillus salipiscarius]
MSLQTADGQLDAQDRRSERAILIDEINAILLEKDLTVVDYVEYKSNSYREDYNALMNRYSELVSQVKPRLDSSQLELMSQIEANNEEMDSIFYDEVVPAVSAREEGEATSARSQFAALRTETQEVSSNLRETVVSDYNRAYQNTKQLLHLFYQL